MTHTFSRVYCVLCAHSSETEMTDAKKPKNRLTLTISDELKHALARLNAATGVAAASFVGEIIESSIPMINGISEAAEAAKAEPAKALQLIQRSMFEALHDISETQMELMDAETKLRTYRKESEA